MFPVCSQSCSQFVPTLSAFFCICSQCSQLFRNNIYKKTLGTFTKPLGTTGNWEQNEGTA